MPKRHTKRQSHGKKVHKKPSIFHGLNVELVEKSLKSLEREATKACKTWNLKWPQEWIRELKSLKQSDVYRTALKQQQVIQKDLQNYTRKITRSFNDIIRLNSRVSKLERQLNNRPSRR